MPFRLQITPDDVACAMLQDAVVSGRKAATVAASRGAVGVRRMAAAAVQESEPAPLYPDVVLKAPEINQAKVGRFCARVEGRFRRRIWGRW